MNNGPSGEPNGRTNGYGNGPTPNGSRVRDWEPGNIQEQSNNTGDRNWQEAGARRKEPEQRNPVNFVAREQDRPARMNAGQARVENGEWPELIWESGTMSGNGNGRERLNSKRQRSGSREEGDQDYRRQRQ